MWWLITIEWLTHWIAIGSEYMGLWESLLTLIIPSTALFGDKIKWQKIQYFLSKHSTKTFPLKLKCLKFFSCQHNSESIVAAVLRSISCLTVDRLLRGTVIRLACGHEYSQCLDSAKDKFTQWLSDPVNNM